MSVRVIVSREEDKAVLYDSVTDTAFGPIIKPADNLHCEDVAYAFLEWLPVDARKLNDDELEDKLVEFRASDPRHYGIDVEV